MKIASRSGLLTLLCLQLTLVELSAQEAGTESAGELTVTFLGTGVARPSLLRSGPAILVDNGQHRFLIDGAGVCSNNS